MRQLLSLAWKEWREVRWVLAFSLIIFVGLPLIGGIEGLRYYGHWQFIASPWVMYLGGLLGMVAAATSVCGDLSGRLPDFWQSRAAGIRPWLLAKYLVGLVVLLIACLIPLLIEVGTAGYDADHSAVHLIDWFPFVWIVQYSLGFVFACLTRRVGPAIIIALAATLLLYCLPIVLPLLKALYVPEVLRKASDPHIVSIVAEQWPFMVISIAISLAALAVGVSAIGYQWRIVVAQKAVYCSLAASALLLFGVGASKLATNLPVLQTIDFDSPGTAVTIFSDGKRGVIFTNDRDDTHYIPPAAFALYITAKDVHLGPRIYCQDYPTSRWGTHTHYAWLANHPDVCFTIGATDYDISAYRCGIELAVQDLLNPSAPPIKFPIGSSGNLEPDLFLLAIGGDELFASWQDQSVIINISDLKHPKISAFSFDEPDFVLQEAEHHALFLPPVPGVPLHQRLSAAVGRGGFEWAAVSDDVMVTDTSRGPFTTYRLEQILTPQTERIPSTTGAPPADSTVARFIRVGRYEPTLLERLTTRNVSEVASENGLVYVSEEGGPFGSIFPHITVFDISDPARPHPIGHFAPPEHDGLSICSLPDGRLLVGGRKLYVLGQPPRGK